MDALSDLFRVVRLTGGVFLEAEFSAPWSVKAQAGPEDCRFMLAAPARLISFHYVISGQLLLQIDGDPPVEVRSGSIVLLPRNDPHTLASQTGLKAVDSEGLIQMDASGGLARLRHGGGGEITRIVCGAVGSEADCYPLLDTLPSTLVLDLNGRSAADWIFSSFRYAARELSAARAGSAAVLAKLSELMFVEAVRFYLEGLPADERGWLAGLRDPSVGKALALLHTDLARPWTAEELARDVYLSRSAFADRFTSLIGIPPITYLTRWRMQVAAQRLRDSLKSVADIAADVGYESELAFAKAFKRQYSLSPSQFRKRGDRPSGAHAAQA
ncbi:MAG TPA: AraC family transcriptional regulator [Terriglobia bacterium]|nr:AraC family transcriptional regulator [Terriglobia bacterium]